MRLKKYIHAAFLLGFISFISMAANDDLAKVWIARFHNSTGSDNYAWLGNSLPDAIDSAMEENFAFRRVVDKDISGKFSPKPGLNDLKKLAEQNDPDYIIFGSYSSADEMMLVESFLFSRSDNKILPIKKFETAADAQIFKTSAKVADEIVDFIKSLVTKQSLEQIKVEKAKYKTVQLIIIEKGSLVIGAAEKFTKFINFNYLVKLEKFSQTFDAMEKEEIETALKTSKAAGAVVVYDAGDEIEFLPYFAGKFRISKKLGKKASPGMTQDVFERVVYTLELPSKKRINLAPKKVSTGLCQTMAKEI